MLVRKNINLLMAFWSPIYRKGGKSERLNKYLDEFDNSKEFLVDYYGFPERPEYLRKKHKSLRKYYGSRICMTAAEITTRIAKRFGRSSMGRHIATVCLSQIASKGSNLDKTDIVFCQPNFWKLVKVAKSKNIPVVLEVDSAYPKDVWGVLRERERINKIPRKNADSWNYYPYVINSLKSIHAADHIIVFSDYAENTFLEAGFPKHRLSKLRPSAPDIAISVPRYPVEPKYVFASNHATRKGLDIVLAAWKNYCEQGGRGHLYICGKKSPSFKTIVENSGQLQRISFLGQINLKQFFATETCVLLHPSFSEGRPRTVLEALAHGCPVVATEASSADIVENNHTGWIVSPTSCALYSTLCQIDTTWESDIRRVSTNAIEAIRHELDNQSYFQDVLKIIKNQMKNGY